MRPGDEGVAIGMFEVEVPVNEDSDCGDTYVDTDEEVTDNNPVGEKWVRAIKSLKINLL